MTEMDRSKPPGIAIAQILLEEVQFSHRQDFLSLPHTTPASIGDIRLEIGGARSPDGKSGLVRVQVTTNPDLKPLYNFRVSMIAVVSADEKTPNMPLEQYMRGSGPALLFPFVREVVASLTWRGRFGPVWLSPTNILAATSAVPAEAQLPADEKLGVPRNRRKHRAGSKRKGR